MEYLEGLTKLYKNLILYGIRHKSLDVECIGRNPKICHIKYKKRRRREEQSIISTSLHYPK